MSIKFLSEDDRPREKFLLKGKSALSDSELLAIILGSGNTEESAVELAQKILKSVDNNWQKKSITRNSRKISHQKFGTSL